MSKKHLARKALKSCEKPAKSLVKMGNYMIDHNSTLNGITPESRRFIIETMAIGAKLSQKKTLMQGIAIGSCTTALAFYVKKKIEENKTEEEA